MKVVFENIGIVFEIMKVVLKTYVMHVEKSERNGYEI